MVLRPSDSLLHLVATERYPLAWICQVSVFSYIESPPVLSHCTTTWWLFLSLDCHRRVFAYIQLLPNGILLQCYFTTLRPLGISLWRDTVVPALHLHCCFTTWCPLCSYTVALQNGARLGKCHWVAKCILLRVMFPRLFCLIRQATPRVIMNL